MSTPPDDLDAAAERFLDEVLAGPAPDPSDVHGYSDYLIKGLFAASDKVVAEERRLREERRNRPEVRARRSAGSRKGWVTRRAREAAEVAEERGRYDDPRAAGPVCDGIYHDSRGSEMPCTLPPDHEDDCGDYAGLPARREAP